MYLLLYYLRFCIHDSFVYMSYFYNLRHIVHLSVQLCLYICKSINSPIKYLLFKLVYTHLPIHTNYGFKK